MANYGEMLKQIYKIYDQDLNGILDEDERRICVTEFLQSIHVSMDVIVDNLWEFMKESVNVKTEKLMSNILHA